MTAQPLLPPDRHAPILGGKGSVLRGVGRELMKHHTHHPARLRLQVITTKGSGQRLNFCIKKAAAGELEHYPLRLLAGEPRMLCRKPLPPTTSTVRVKFGNRCANAALNVTSRPLLLSRRSPRSPCQSEGATG
jgi:hypothetical protein